MQRDPPHLAEADTALARAIDRALMAPWYVLNFTPELEAQYTADTKADRMRYQLRAGLAGLVLLLLSIPSDAEMVPDVFSQGLGMYAVSVVIGLTMLSLLRPRNPDWLTNLAIMLYTFPATTTQTMMFIGTHSPEKSAYLNALSVNVMFANVCLQQRFRWAAAGCAGLLALLLGALQTGGIPVPTQHSLQSALISTGILTLIIAHRLEWQQRRAYLFRIRDSLRKVELQRTNARLLDLSERDGLTGLANRRAVDRMLVESWADCAANNHPMAVIMVDVDYFKKFNDEYGHPAGDECLRQVAGALHQHVRLTGDLAGRFGGEEFILILPGADAEGAAQVAARACAAVAALQIPHAAAPVAGYVTASLGLASAQPARGGTLADLVRAADAALYEAKQTGRARVVATEIAF